MADTQPDLLTATLEAWAYSRASLVDEVENLPAERFDFRPTDESRTVAELVRHILQAGLMAAGELSRSDGDFTRQGYPEFIQEYAGSLGEPEDKEELLSLLRRTHEEGDERLRERGSAFMLQPIKQFNGEPAARLTWLNHHIAHEDYHRGQIALYARLLGLVPALTRRIQGAAADDGGT